MKANLDAEAQSRSQTGAPKQGLSGDIMNMAKVGLGAVLIDIVIK